VLADPRPLFAEPLLDAGEAQLGLLALATARGLARLRPERMPTGRGDAVALAVAVDQLNPGVPVRHLQRVLRARAERVLDQLRGLRALPRHLAAAQLGEAFGDQRQLDSLGATQRGGAPRLARDLDRQCVALVSQALHLAGSETLGALGPRQPIGIGVALTAQRLALAGEVGEVGLSGGDAALQSAEPFAGGRGLALGRRAALQLGLAPHQVGDGLCFDPLARRDLDGRVLVGGAPNISLRAMSSSAGRSASWGAIVCSSEKAIIVSPSCRLERQSRRFCVSM
jgi:hypothetical protein